MCSVTDRHFVITGARVSGIAKTHSRECDCGGNANTNQCAPTGSKL